MKYTHVVKSCPRTIAHVLLHISEADKALSASDYEQAKHDISIAFLLLKEIRGGLIK